MSKISERIFSQDGKLIIHQQHDFQRTIEAATAARNAGAGDLGESKAIGRIPAKLAAMWAKEAGVAYGSDEHMRIMEKKMLDGEFAKLRIWEGTF